MFFVYIIRSAKIKQLYVGFTTDIERRLNEHNLNQNRSTKNRGPWKLIYYEAFLSKHDALVREKALKNFGRSYGQLKRRIQNCLNEGDQ